MATLLLILAILLLGFCAFGVEKVKGVHLGWLGLMVWASLGLIAAI